MRLVTANPDAYNNSHVFPHGSRVQVPGRLDWVLRSGPREAKIRVAAELALIRRSGEGPRSGLTHVPGGFGSLQLWDQGARLPAGLQEGPSQEATHRPPGSAASTFRARNGSRSPFCAWSPWPGLLSPSPTEFFLP